MKQWKEQGGRDYLLMAPEPSHQGQANTPVESKIKRLATGVWNAIKNNPGHTVAYATVFVTLITVGIPTYYDLLITKPQEKAAEEKTAQKKAKDTAQENIGYYLADIEDMIENEGLKEAQPEAEVSQKALTKTQDVLELLEEAPEYKGKIVRILLEKKLERNVGLAGANLSDAKLSGVGARGANLTPNEDGDPTKLSGASLNGADL